MRLPNLTTARCSIRLAEPRDVDRIVRYWRENGSRYSPALPESLLVPEYWEQRVLQAYREHLDGTACKLYVLERDESAVIGTITFGNVLRGVHHQATLGYGVAGSHEGRGFMTEALERAIRYAFDELRLHRIEASYREDNVRSQRLLARLGFEREGVLREALLVDGVWQNHILTAKLNPGWKQPGAE